MGFELDLQGGDKLIASHVPGREKPYLGIRRGNTFIALAEFISDDDMNFLRDELKRRIIMPVMIDNPGALNDEEDG